MAARGERRWAVAAGAGAALSWSALVAASPPAFFGVAAAFCAGWLALSALAAPPGLSARLRPRLAEVAIGLGTGLALYALSRATLAGLCGGVTDLLCEPLASMFQRFRTRTPGAALALALLIAPAEELFWRGVVQARLAARLGQARAVLSAAAMPALLALLTGEPLLALATLPTYATWGLLLAWRGGLVAPLVSHATWSLLIASLAPPV
jgi:membrane protease YdiL (CAAX protease family)